MKKIKAIKVQGWVKVLPVYLFTLLPTAANMPLPTISP